MVCELSGKIAPADLGQRVKNIKATSKKISKENPPDLQIRNLISVLEENGRIFNRRQTVHTHAHNHSSI